MTAQVAVLNTNGIALASDSAVTIVGGGQSRSYQSADKIFPIHDVPLAVLHSGNAAIWGVPWQLLVEMWAQQRQAGQAQSVEGYAQEFTSWLAAQQNLTTESAQDDFFRWTFRDYMLAVRARVRRELEETDVELVAGYVDGSTGALVDQVVEDYVNILAARESFRGMDDVDAAAVCKRLAKQLDGDLTWVFDDTPRTGEFDRQANVIAEMLVRKAEPFDTDAVLAFAGYGQDDYFPSLYRMTVSGVVGGVVRIYDDSHEVVDASNRVSIMPLGLTDAIQAFLRGTSPDYRNAAHHVLDGYVEGNGDDKAAAAAEGAHKQLDAEFDDLEWRKFLSPMLDIVETLPLVETLRLADSLVGLASLRQLIQGESSVGGPIDLARVTKHGGFEWVRSKKTRASGTFAR